MADPNSCPPLTRDSVKVAHHRIQAHIYRTPIATCQTLDRMASSSADARAERAATTTSTTTTSTTTTSTTTTSTTSTSTSTTTTTSTIPTAGTETPIPGPKMKLFFKCEHQQRIGAFKARGAFHALGRLIEMEGVEEVRAKGVVTHSSGNHAQALALAAKVHGIPAHIVMPTISTPSKISGTKSHGANVIFSGSTSEERESVVAKVIAETGARLIPPYDHPDVILGQGTQALELEEQVREFLEGNASRSVDGKKMGLDAVIAPIGGGGMLAGIATALYGTGIKVFGAEPNFEGANDAEMGLERKRRVESVKSLTIADGLRTPVGEIPWSVVSDKEKVEGVYSVSEEEIKAALKLAMERAKLFIEPSAAVPLAVVLYNEAFRRRMEEMGREGGGGGGVNLGVVLSGGNTTVEALAKLFAPSEREAGQIGADGEKVAENVAG